MNSREHPPPHVHVWYSGGTATVDIGRSRISAGRLPRRIARLVFEWIRLHRVALFSAWERAQAGLGVPRFPPLE
jgi:hypothetical protein